MISTITAFLLALITLLISLIHFHWALGGRWALASVLPTKESGASLFKPGPLLTLAVAMILLLISLYYCSLVCAYPLRLPNWIMQYGLIILGIVFLLRAVGDFKYIGFFKKVRNTTFGRLDSKYFSPLCLLLALGSFGLYFLIN